MSKKLTQESMLSSVSISFLENRFFLHKFLARFLSHQHDIEDAVQETYLKAYSAECNKNIEQPKAFLYSIAKNIALNELKKKSRQMTDYIEECQADLPEMNFESLEDEIEAHQSLGLYCEAVAALPETCRRVYLLRSVHGLKHKEIADRLGISLSAVEKNLSKGIRSCRSYMQSKHNQAAPVFSSQRSVINSVAATN